ncbi:MAG: Hsp33 family molecular chaperone HslO [Ghiorsea sp.]
MVKVTDELVRFLLPEVKVRGAIIRGSNIIKEAVRTHGLDSEPADLFGHTLLASIILLSVSKGGVRQVLQLDAKGDLAPIQRMQAECKNGTVRGYVQWREEAAQRLEGEGIGAWMGKDVLLSTIRDLGVGQPYISTIQHESNWVAEHIMHYLAQSVQVQADVILYKDIGLMLEAMPDCDDESWFKAVESMAKISNQSLEKDNIEDILKSFDVLGCKVVGQDEYAYECSCSAESMEKVLESMSAEALEELADDDGKVILSCQYCKRISDVDLKEGRKK